MLIIMSVINMNYYSVWMFHICYFVNWSMENLNATFHKTVF